MYWLWQPFLSLPAVTRTAKASVKILMPASAILAYAIPASADASAIPVNVTLASVTKKELATRNAAVSAP